MSSTLPFSISYSVVPPAFSPSSDGLAIERTVSQMGEAFYDQAAVSRTLRGRDPLVVQVWMAPVPETADHFMTCMTVIHPGKVGDEYFMTKGHIHLAPPPAPEVYVTLEGNGKLVMQTPEGAVDVQDMAPGLINYIPPGWAHRTVNTGGATFVFLGVFPAGAKRDYSFIGVGKDNFAKVVVERDGLPTVIDNPSDAKRGTQA